MTAADDHDDVAAAAGAPIAATGAPRYVPLRHLASGGMADVILAREERPGGIARRVVIKRVLPHLLREARFVAMFEDEARLAMQLAHPNIAQVLDAGRAADGAPYLVMEWLDGADARALATAAQEAGERLDPAVACAVVAAAARGLHHAHTRLDTAGRPLGVVHRDVSPHNLFATRDGTVKVLDFGIAKSAAQLSVTETGQIKGKLRYMAPEQLADGALDARTDLFALGCVLWELLVGERLWERGSQVATMRAIAEDPAPPPSARLPAADAARIPPELDRLTLALLAKFRAGRPPDAEVVASALDALVHAMGCTSPTRAVADAVARYAPPAPEEPAPTTEPAPSRGAGEGTATATSRSSAVVAGEAIAPARAAAPATSSSSRARRGVTAAAVLVALAGLAAGVAAVARGSGAASAPRAPEGPHAAPQQPAAAVVVAAPGPAPAARVAPDDEIRAPDATAGAMPSATPDTAATRARRPRRAPVLRARAIDEYPRDGRR